MRTQIPEPSMVAPGHDLKRLKGPFDIIGDVHGCYDELCALLTKLGYTVDEAACAAIPPRGRMAVFVGDLCDRGPKNVQVLRLVMGMVQAGMARCVAGNHDAKLARCLNGAKVKLLHGLDGTVEQLAQQPPAFVEEVKAFTNGLVSHYVLDEGKLVVAHAGIKEQYQGQSSPRVRDFCLYGDTTGQVDEYGLPVRLPWAKEYRGKALVVYGHTPLREVQRFYNAVCIDTGCVFGGKLTGYRYPEGEIVQVEALRMYCQPARPLAAEAPEATALGPEDSL